jgi:hypothetical protein
LAFHAANVVFHAVASLLLLALLHALGAGAGAVVGAALFAVHPVHTEAVANVVGRAEIYAACFYLAACLLYWRGRSWQGWRRPLRLLGLALLYFLALSSKEIGVTLPGALLLLELYAARSDRERALPGFLRGMRRESATWLLLVVTLAAYLGLRFFVLGTVRGERVAPIFEFVGPSARVLTAVAAWFEYLRLLVFPVDLVSHYEPAVRFPSEGLDARVALGAATIGALIVVALRSWKRFPLVSLGIAFVAVAILPVSNLLFPTGVVLAERTLYLPSVGVSLVAAGLTAPMWALPRTHARAALAIAVLAGASLLARTTVRNPAWMDSFVMVQTLNDEHPESWRAFHARARGLERVGEIGAAAASWDQAVRLMPTHYSLLVEAAAFHRRSGDPGRSETYLRRAIAVEPRLANAYEHLGNHFLRFGLGRAAHGVALEGLARAGRSRELWRIVSESYIMKGDLAAAVRAREVVLAIEPGSDADRRRMRELLDAMPDSPPRPH